MVQDPSRQPGLPEDFLWGFATAAYQIEGGANDDGRGASIWDTFCKIPGKIADGSSGDVACDSYHRHKEDIELLKKTGAMAYRFSVSWSRVIPLGGRNDPINEKGLDYYRNLVNDLLDAGITPLLTLFHWDLPDELYKRYDGFLNKTEFVLDFERYARVLFEALPQVKHWITFNEPFCSAVLGHNFGIFAPGHTSNREIYHRGDGSTETWIVGHSILNAHAMAVKVYRDEFKPKNGGEIAITLNGDWADAWDPEDPEDVIAAQRKIEFSIAWFADPVYFGHYPESMRKQLGDRLPEFTPEEAELIKGSNDYYGMNHYCANYIKHKTGPIDPNDHAGHLEVLQMNKAGEAVGPKTQSFWLQPSAPGFRKLLGWISDRYGGPKIYVTENGTSITGENDKPKEEILNDEFRVWYFTEYVKAMAEAVAIDGVDVRAYMGWSLMDNFEWAEGYETRFGVTFVDYENGQTRYPKKSALELKNIFAQYIGKLPAVNGKSVETATPVADEKPVETASVVTDEIPAETAAPVTEETAVETAVPVLDETPVETTVPILNGKPEETTLPENVEQVETATPATDDTPVETVPAVAEDNVVEDTLPAAEEKAAEEAQPVENGAPIEPTLPVANGELVETVQPAEEDKPVESALPTANGETEETTLPIANGEPVETSKTENPVETAVNGNSVETATNGNSVEAAENEKPVELAQTEQPAETIENGTPIQSIENGNHVKAAEDETPVEAAEIAKPVETTEAVKPVEVFENGKPAEIVENGKPVEVVENGKPAETSLPAKSGKPVEVAEIELIQS